MRVPYGDSFEVVPQLSNDGTSDLQHEKLSFPIDNCSKTGNLTIVHNDGHNGRPLNVQGKNDRRKTGKTGRWIGGQRLSLIVR